MAFAHTFAYNSVPEQHNTKSIEARHPAFYESPGSKAAVVNPTTIDSRVMSSDQIAQYRRDSCTNSAGVLSPPVEHKWEPKFEPHGLGIDTGVHMTPSNPFPMHQQQQFNQPSTTNATSSLTHAPSDMWTNGPHDYYTSAEDFDAHQFPPTSMEHSLSHSSYASYGPAHQEPIYVSSSDSRTPLSPGSTTEWLNIAANESQGRPLPKRRDHTASVEHRLSRRPDGIRKKNTRIEIPLERSLTTIERLIEQSKNEDDIKELKGQRRLLRNREAALASRQRKKKHTEELEVKEKNYVSQISTLESELSDLKIQLSQQHQEFCNVVNTLHSEKQELVLKHTDESGQLRRKVQYLTEQVENVAPTMSAGPSSSGFTDVTSDLDALTVAGPHDWDSLYFPNESQDLSAYGYQNYPPANPEPIATALTRSNDLTKGPATSTDQPIASGILFMLLLCGAFVASSKSGSVPVIPRMPDEVRAASTTVLDSLLANSRSDMVLNGMPSINAHEPLQSTGVWNSQPGSSSHASAMHRQLTSPSKRQEAEQIFAMTPAQYNNIVNPGHDSSQQDHASTGPDRRNLAQTLANLREESIAKGGAAEVYTRSLLWDQIPTEVVTQFKELVRESKQQNVAINDQDGAHLGYKLEA